MNKLIGKLNKLSSQATMKYWNGGYIKRVSIGNSDSKVFQCNGIKYKLELSAERKCDNTTNFIPTIPEIRLTDWRQGRSYIGEHDIAKFLGIEASDVLNIYNDMITQSAYTQDEIDENIRSYKRFLTSFRRDFLGEEVSKEELRNESINEILS